MSKNRDTDKSVCVPYVCVRVCVRPCVLSPVCVLLCLFVNSIQRQTLRGLLASWTSSGQTV